MRARVRNSGDRAAGSEKGARPGRAGDRAGSGVQGPGRAGNDTARPGHKDRAGGPGKQSWGEERGLLE